MRVGELRHRVSIQTQVETSDGMGGSVISWSDVYNDVPAAIWPLSANERLDSMKLELQTTHKIRIRYLSGLTADNRIVFGSRTFNIISIINADERNRQLDILATEEV